jgi:hypothetical protein
MSEASEAEIVEEATAAADAGGAATAAALDEARADPALRPHLVAFFGAQRDFIVAQSQHLHVQLRQLRLRTVADGIRLVLQAITLGVVLTLLLIFVGIVSNAWMTTVSSLKRSRPLPTSRTAASAARGWRRRFSLSWARSAARPMLPFAYVEHGQIRLAQGDVAGALVVLRKAVHQAGPLRRCLRGSGRCARTSWRSERGPCEL